jgi:hypothetical protein
MSMQDPPSVVGDLSDERFKPKSLRINSKELFVVALGYVQVEVTG